MPSFPVSKEKEKQLAERMKSLGIHEDAIKENFIRGSGSGGQKINKTSSCVQLTYDLSRIDIKCQERRSRGENRYHARVRLCDKVEEQQLGELSKKKQADEKIRRQKRTRSRKAKRKLLENKKHRSDVKETRKPVSHDEE